MKENNEYFKKLEIGLEALNTFAKKLIIFNIDIKTKPWYKNILEIYVQQANEFYQKCKDNSFDFNEFNDFWIKSNFKGFLSEVEKFIKFIVKTILKIEDNINFYRSINELDNVVKKYKNLFDNQWVGYIQEIKNNLNNWRENYNENKHDEDKLDDNFFIKERTGFILKLDVLEYVSDFIYYIMLLLLSTLIKILENN